MTSDEKADGAIKAMVGGAIAAALIPAHVNWALFAGGLSLGVVSIASCYGVTITKDDGWKLVKQIFGAAGFTFIAVNLGSKFITAVLESTGIGYVGGVALDAAISGATAYAIGGAAKAYFKGERKKEAAEAMGNIFRERFKQAKSNPEFIKQHSSKTN